MKMFRLSGLIEVDDKSLFVVVLLINSKSDKKSRVSFFMSQISRVEMRSKVRPFSSRWCFTAAALSCLALQLDGERAASIVFRVNTVAAAEVKIVCGSLLPQPSKPLPKTIFGHGGRCPQTGKKSELSGDAHI